MLGESMTKKRGITHQQVLGPIVQRRRGRWEWEGSHRVKKPDHTGNKNQENLNSIKTCFVLFFNSLGKRR